MGDEHQNLPVIRVNVEALRPDGQNPAAWGVLLQAVNQGVVTRERLVAGRLDDKEPSRVYLTAAIRAFKLVKRPCNISIYTSSKYIFWGVTRWINSWKNNGWVREKDMAPVLNQDLWKELDSSYSHFPLVYWDYTRDRIGRLHEALQQAQSHGIAIDEEVSHIGVDMDTLLSKDHFGVTMVIDPVSTSVCPFLRLIAERQGELPTLMTVSLGHVNPTAQPLGQLYSVGLSA